MTIFEYIVVVSVFVYAALLFALLVMTLVRDFRGYKGGVHSSSDDSVSIDKDDFDNHKFDEEVQKW